MSTSSPAPTVQSTSAPARSPLAPDRYERFLAIASILLLLAVLAALARGQSQWHLIPDTVWVHLATIGIALVLTPVMLLRRRGDQPHRLLGWVWSASLLLTAVDSFWIRLVNQGQFSFIHLLSVFTLIQVPLIIRSARRHDMKRHRRTVRGMVTGALLVAGFFTFPFDRLLGHWLFG